MLGAMPDEDHGLFDGPSLDADGKLVKRPGAADEGDAAAPTEAGAPPPTDDAPIELAERTAKHVDPTPEAYRDEPKPPRRAPKVALVLGVLVLALLAGALLLASQDDRGQWRSPLDALQGHHTVLITSEPDGATVRLGTQVLGKTPWAGDNIFGDGEVVVELKGYQPWKGRLRAGEDVVLRATLKR
jgi:hypothetical protein